MTEIYVDPSIAADSGTGTIGDPFGDLEYAIEQTTFDTTNGTRVNVKAGSTETLAADLSVAFADTSVSVAWVPSDQAPCVIQGYTSAAGDGGIGVISGGGTVTICNSGAVDHTHFVDLRLTASNGVTLSLDNNCAVIGCEIDNQASAVKVIDVEIGCIVFGNYLHDNVTTNAIIDMDGPAAYCMNNYVEVPANSSGIRADTDTTILHNIVVCTAANSDGILVASSRGSIQHNSVYSSANGTGTGIEISNGQYPCHIANNLVEGFSGAGGVGISWGATSTVQVYGGNAVYDCTTEYSGSPRSVRLALGDNETLTASPFNDAATGDFSPVDTGNVKEGALPQIIGGGLVP